MIYPLSVGTFFKKHWPNNYVSIRGSPDRLKDFVDLPEFQSVYSLLRAWNRSVNVCLPRVRDESHSIWIPPKEAEKLYDEGMNLIFQSAEDQLPSLRPCLARLVADLGLPSSVAARCLIYASPRSEGASWHFDQNVNFVFQLRGTKVWRLAPNKHVLNPLHRYSMKMGLADGDELGGYCESPLPTNTPPKSEKVVLRPGSFLFLPRGWWHTTRSSEESLSLNFTLDQPSWSDLVLLAIRRRLIRFPHWRELADGAGGEGSRVKAAKGRIDSLLKLLFEDIGPLSADDLIREAGRRFPSALKKTASARFSAAGGRVNVWSLHKGRTCFEIDPESKPFFRWLKRQEGPFDVADAQSRLPRLTHDLVEILLEALIQAGVLESA